MREVESRVESRIGISEAASESEATSESEAASDSEYLPESGEEEEEEESASDEEEKVAVTKDMEGASMYLYARSLVRQGELEIGSDRGEIKDTEIHS